MVLSPIAGILGRTGVLGKQVSQGLSPLLSKLADPTIRLTRENIQSIWKSAEFRAFSGGGGMATDAAASIARYARDVRANRLLLGDASTVKVAHLRRLPQSITRQRTRYRYLVKYEYKGIDGQDVVGHISVGENKLLSTSQVEEAFQTKFEFNLFDTDLPVQGVDVDRPKVTVEELIINDAIRRER